MQRYPVIVCRNCGTEYNATRPVCPGFQCFEPTPKLEDVEQVRREFRAGPVISNPEAVPEGVGGLEVSDAEPEQVEEAEEQEDDE